jgi:hypothetical protein
MAENKQRDHDFDDWIDKILVINPGASLGIRINGFILNVSDDWVQAARAGWDARKEFDHERKS